MHKLGQLPIKLARDYKVWYIYINKQTKCVLYIYTCTATLKRIKQNITDHYIYILSWYGREFCMPWVEFKVFSLHGL